MKEGRTNRRVQFFIFAAVVILAAAAVGISIYNTPANRLRRQLDLGNRYLEEQQYEQAVLAFEQAIAIDDRCLDAYAGGMDAYLGMGDISGAQDFYDRTLGMLSGLDADFLAGNLDGAVELYLAADEVYGDDWDRIAQALEEGYAVTGEDSRIREVLVENYIRIGKRETQNGSYEEALAVYDRLIELDRENAEMIHDLCDCLNRYIDVLMEAGEYDKIRELAEKYSEVAAEIDFSAFLTEVSVEMEELERDDDWVEISPQFFEFRLMGADLWEDHSGEIWEALLPLVQSGMNVVNLRTEFMMENRVYAGREDEYGGRQNFSTENGTQICIRQMPGSDVERYGDIEYDAYSDQVWLLLQNWDGGYLWENGQRRTSMQFENFIDCPFAKTGNEWYSLINIEQIKEKGQQVEIEDRINDDMQVWQFLTEWGEACYCEYEMETDRGSRQWCAVAVDCIEQGKIYSVNLIIEPDDGIDIVYICAGKNYAWNMGMLEKKMDVFQIYEQ